ncbi:MAG: hypothetical protein PHI27_06655 [Eubacteriales bacterium]|nr:hypothetical protein [Eubacteriales bacterium]MDD4513754.1 hypothetical protein [Eubacteriales bacterium]
MSNENTREPNGLIEKPEAGALIEAQIVADVVKQVLTPILGALGEMLKHNTQALDQLAATQSVQNDRMEALEKQIRLNTPVSQGQVRYLNDAIKKRARELLYKREIEDAKAVRKLGNAIRKSVLARYGIASLHEIPKHEYTVAMSQIGMWNDALCVLDVAREYRAAEGGLANG